MRYSFILFAAVAALSLSLCAACTHESAQIAPAETENIVPGELFTLTDSREEAEELAELYGITLKSFESGVAVFTTCEDLDTVIRRGEENGWQPLEKNYIQTAQ